MLLADNCALFNGPDSELTLLARAIAPAVIQRTIESCNPPQEEEALEAAMHAEGDIAALFEAAALKVPKRTAVFERPKVRAPAPLVPSRSASHSAKRSRNVDDDEEDEFNPDDDDDDFGGSRASRSAARGASRKKVETKSNPRRRGQRRRGEWEEDDDEDDDDDGEVPRWSSAPANAIARPPLKLKLSFRNPTAVKSEPADESPSDIQKQVKIEPVPLVPSIIPKLKFKIKPPLPPQ